MEFTKVQFTDDEISHMVDFVLSNAYNVTYHINNLKKDKYIATVFFSKEYIKDNQKQLEKIRKKQLILWGEEGLREHHGWYVKNIDFSQAPASFLGEFERHERDREWLEANKADLLGLPMEHEKYVAFSQGGGIYRAIREIDLDAFSSVRNMQLSDITYLCPSACILEQSPKEIDLLTKQREAGDRFRNDLEEEYVKKYEGKVVGIDNEGQVYTANSEGELERELEERNKVLLFAEILERPTIHI